MRLPYKKGLADQIRISKSSKKLVDEYRYYKWKLEGETMSQRDVVDASLNIAGIKEAIKRMKTELRREGKI